MPQIEDDTGNKVTYADTAYDSPEPGFVLNAGKATREVKVNWVDQVKAVKAFVGFAQMRVSPTGIRYIHRAIPDDYPLFFNLAGKPWLWCVGAPTVKGKGKPLGTDANGLNSFRYAYITLNYSSLTYEIVPDPACLGNNNYQNAAPNPLKNLPDESRLLRYVTRVIKPYSRIISLPFGFMRVIGARNLPDPPGNGLVQELPLIGPRGQLIREGIPIRQAGMDVRYTWHCVPEEAIPIEAIQNSLSCVNDADFDVFQANTLLFEDIADLSPERSPIGDRIYTITYKFKYLPNKARSVVPPAPHLGHNYLLRLVTADDIPQPDMPLLQPGDVEYLPVSSNGYEWYGRPDNKHGTPIYDFANFEKLFQPDQNAKPGLRMGQ